MPSGGSARPRPIFGPLHPGGALGVSLHLAPPRQEMLVGLHPKRWVAARVDMPVSGRPGARMITLRVGERDASQEFRQVAVRSRRQHQVPVIRHPTVTPNAPGHESQTFFPERQKILLGGRSLEKAGAEIGAVQHVVNLTPNIHSPASTHTRILLPSDRKEKGS